MGSAIIACVLLLAAATTAQSVKPTARETGALTFQNYPAELGFRGKAAKPILVTPLEHKYRTEIREQARKGPDFAGHFTLAKWGCGSPCLQFVIINATSGAIYDPGIVVGCANKNGLAARIDFRFESRLIAATGSSETTASSNEVDCGTNYYQWDGKRLIFVHFNPWPKSSP